MMNTKKNFITFALMTLLLAIIACTINIGGPAYPTPAIPISTEAILSLEQDIQTAVASGAQAGRITLVITEPQLTSYLAFKLETQSDPFITNPQAYLRDGQMQIYGTARQGYFEATVNIILTAGVDEQGQLKIELTSADFGPLPVPDDLKAAITTIIAEAYAGMLGPVATGFRLEGIIIADGTMTLTGRIK